MCKSAEKGLVRRKSAMSVAAASSSTGWSAVGPVYDPYAAATAAKNGDQHGLSPFDHSFSDSSSAAAASGAVSSSSAVKANFLTDQEGGRGGKWNKREEEWEWE